MSRSVTIATGKTNVQLPNGKSYDAGKTVILTDDEFAQVNSALIPGTVIDNGPSITTGDQVVAQGADVGAPAALTSTDAAAATPTQAEFNALRADVVALRTTVAALETALSGTGKALA